MTDRALFCALLALLLLPGCPSGGGDDDDATGDDDDATGDDDDATGDDDDATGDDDDATGDDDDATGDDDDATAATANFIALGSGGAAWLMNFDGADLTPVAETDPSGGDSTAYYSAAAGAGAGGTVAVAGDASFDPFFSVSTDGGLNWTVANTGFDPGYPIGAIANGNGDWVAASGTGDYYYGDGTSWTEGTYASTGFGGEIAFGNGAFVNTVGMRTTDGGATWVSPTTAPPVGAQTNLSTVLFGDGRFVTAQYTQMPAWSDDGGDTWTAGTTEAGTAIADFFPQIYGGAFGDGTFVVGGEGLIAYSDGGAHFDVATLPDTWDYYTGVVYLDGLGFLATAGTFTGATILHSDDGATWTALPTELPVPALHLIAL